MEKKKTRRTYQARRVYGSERTDNIVPDIKLAARVAGAVLIGYGAFIAIGAAIYGMGIGDVGDSPQLLAALVGMVAGIACAVYGGRR